MPDRLRLVFTTAKGFSPVSWVIRRFGQDDVSHVGIQDGGIVLSAEGQGVVEQSLDDFLDGRRSVYVFEATEEGAKHLDLPRARGKIGTRYGFETLPGFAIANALGGKNPFGDRAASLVCSELTLYLDDETGFIAEWIGLDPETTSPQRLAEAMLKGGPTFSRLA